MKSLQEVGNEIWSTLWYLLPGREHERAALAQTIASIVLERPSFFDKDQYQADVEDEPELFAKAEMVMVVLKVLATLEKHG